MRIVYSFYPSKSGEIKDIEKILNYSKISLDLSKKISDKVILYTTSEYRKIFEDYGVDYTEINTELFDNYSGSLHNYAIPKILTYIDQKEPYIHLDYDTMLLKLPKMDSEVFFGYFDYDVPNFKKLKDYESLSKYYLEDYGLISDNLPEELRNGFEIKQTPNFSLFGVNSPELVSDTFRDMLNFFMENEDVFNKMNHSPSQIEQFLFIPFLLHRNKEINPYCFIQQENPVMCDDKCVYFKNYDSFQYKTASEDTFNSYVGLSLENKDFTFLHLTDMKRNHQVERAFLMSLNNMIFI